MTRPDDQYEALRQTGQLTSAPPETPRRSQGALAMQKSVHIAYAVAAGSVASVIPTMTVLAGVAIIILVAIVVGTEMAIRRTLLQENISVSDYVILLWRLPRDILLQICRLSGASRIVVRTLVLLPLGYLTACAISLVQAISQHQQLNLRLLTNMSFALLPRVILAVPLALALLRPRNRKNGTAPHTGSLVAGSGVLPGENLPEGMAIGIWTMAVCVLTWATVATPRPYLPWHDGASVVDSTLGSIPGSPKAYDSTVARGLQRSIRTSLGCAVGRPVNAVSISRLRGLELSVDIRLTWSILVQGSALRESSIKLAQNQLVTLQAARVLGLVSNSYDWGITHFNLTVVNAPHKAGSPSKVLRASLAKTIYPAKQTYESPANVMRDWSAVNFASVPRASLLRSQVPQNC